MSWVKLDDSMPDDGKVANLSDSAFRAYVTAICYAGRMLTDGLVPRGTAMKMLGPGRRGVQLLSELVPLLWHERGDGCQSEICTKLLPCLPQDHLLIHNYLKYNPTREQVLDKRAKDLKRKGYGNGA